MIELGEAVGRQIHRAVGQDVALDAGEHANAVDAPVQLADARGMGQRAGFVEPVGHRQRLAVIGDGDVLESGVARREHHRLEVVLAVRLGRVHVQVAAQVGERR